MQTAYSFLHCLTHADADGRIIIQPIPEARPSVGAALDGDRNERKISALAVKYVLLNPAVHFREIVDSARSVILAGGTLHPVQDLVSQVGFRRLGLLVALLYSALSTVVWTSTT